MIQSNHLFEMLIIMIGHNRYAKVTGNFEKQHLIINQMGNLGQISLYLCNFISHGPL